MRTIYDQFAKQVTLEALGKAGAVHTDQEVSPDAGRIDVYFAPDGAMPGDALSMLGLLGRIGTGPCTLEPFHHTPSGMQVLDCLCKHHWFRKLLTRRKVGAPLPLQWIISAGRPDGVIAGLRFDPLAEVWGPGIYEISTLLHTRLVVVAELPETRDTLLLRLMGAGKVLERAIRELESLPPETLERALALPILLQLRLDVRADPMKRTKEDEEFMMLTQNSLEKYTEEQRNIGRAEGIHEALLELYADRFGPPPAEVEGTIRQVNDRAVLRAWHKLVATGSAEDVRSAIRAHRTS